MKGKNNAMIIVVCVLVLVVILALVIFPPSRGKIPAYTDLNGNIIPESIAERTSVDSDGFPLNLTILGKNKDNPVLLVCGGGPGIPQYLLEYLYPSVLPDMFTVCYWDYRGTGLSRGTGASAHNGTDAADNADFSADKMTLDRYMSDADAVTKYLSERFYQEKIYIMGHSFGTYIALNMVKNHPENYVAYIAMAQIADEKKSEIMAYEYMKNQYEQLGNTRMVKEFEEYDINESEEAYQKYQSSSLRDKAMHELGVGTARNMKSVISGIFLPSLRCKAYAQTDRINIWKGKFASHSYKVAVDSIKFNAFTDVESVDIPIYFMVGKYDCTCMASLQIDYYNTVKAPKKELYIFDDSAHSPLYEEPERARQVLEEILEKNRKK